MAHGRMVDRREEEGEADWSSRQRSASAGVSARSRPRASNRSALPDRLETERLPCLATQAPAPAATRAAADEMLKVPVQSPPVPTVSTQPATRGVIRLAAASRERTPPVISSTVSPLTRRPIRKAGNLDIAGLAAA